MLSDAVGLGVFTAIGANAAMSHHVDASFLVVSMGVITGIGGGILRDICAQDIPLRIPKRNLRHRFYFRGN